MPIYLNNAKVEQVRTGVTPSPAGSPPLAPTADGAVGTSTDYARADHQHPSELPSGGSAGQVLTKTASGEAWADAPSDASLAETVAALQKDLGTGGKNCRVAWGSYTGTGVYGASHPNSIACDFTPVLLAVYNKDSNNITPVFAFREMTEFGYNSSGGSCQTPSPQNRFTAPF